MVDHIKLLADEYDWGYLDVEYLINIINQYEYMFGGYADLPCFESIRDYGEDPEDINNYIYIVLESYADCFYDQAIGIAEDENNYDVSDMLKDEYESLDIYVNYLDSFIQVESGEDIMSYDSVEDYVSKF